MEELTHILIFKTNISTTEDKLRVKEVLSNTAFVNEWSVDCEDIDCVLRIVSYELSAEQIINLINQAGFECRELE
ncbi:hypothetical protein CNR22_16295 [Sphingobacteriaceae bacterium]|nr:hypothetical protein CNR22_16295 [Sphingobacteriaceae bacterium]